MQNISVIIPTLQKNLKVLNKLLNILSEDSAVDEILVINNIKKPLEINQSKVRVHNSKRNKYVNASWNFGIKNIKNDIFLIMHDDILCCKNLCSIVLSSGIFNDKNAGLIGIDTRYIVQNNKETAKDIDIPNITNPEEIEIFPMDEITNIGDWASAFFGRKENYYTIPKDLKIVCGDNYIVQKNLANKKRNYSIKGLPFNHIHSLSSASSEFQAMARQDEKNFSKYFDRDLFLYKKWGLVSCNK